MAGVSAHGGVEATANPKPGSRGYLKWWWVYGPGRARWTTWTELHTQLMEHISKAMADRVASAWFHERHGYWPGHQRGKNPKGPG